MAHNIYFHESRDIFELMINDAVDVDANVIDSMLSDLLSHPNWTAESCVLANHQNISFATHTDGFAIEMAIMTIEHFTKCPPKKVAFVVSDIPSEGKAKLWEVVTKARLSLNIEIFGNINAANRWLSLA